MKIDEEDRVATAFRNQTIFLTGGSGFMGKIFIERLLRVTEFDKIYILIRPKKGIQPEERLKELFKDMVFEKVLEDMDVEKILSRVKAIPGDCEQLGLGISENDRNFIIENMTMIFHFAATIRFDEKLKKAVLMNLRGTREMIKLGLECKKLLFFGHMSTAYCHLHVPYLLEKPYDPPADPHEIIKTIEEMDKPEEEIENFSKILLAKLNLPNTYAFTKCLAEALVVTAKEKHNLPVMIFRPSIVISTWRDPIPGYIDNFNGPVGMLLAAGKGVARSIYCDQKSYGDFLPCDIAINGVFVCTWNFFNYYNPEHYIINFTSSQEIQFSWEQVSKLGMIVAEQKYPLNTIFWYPSATMTKHRWLHNIRSFLFHWIPAYVTDFFLARFGYEQFMKRAARRIAKGMEVVEYYANNQWDFDNTVQCAFRERLNDFEEDRYKVNSRGINLQQILTDAALGCRRYVLKTPDHMLPAAFAEMRRMYIIDKTCKSVIYGGLVYWLYGLILALMSGSNVFVTIFKIAICIFCFIL